MTNLKQQSILARSNRVSFEVIEGQVVLLHLDQGNYYYLNEVGTDFWLSLDGRMTIDQQAQLIGANYEALQAAVLQDLLALAQELVEKGLATLSQGRD